VFQKSSLVISIYYFIWCEVLVKISFQLAVFLSPITNYKRMGILKKITQGL